MYLLGIDVGTTRTAAAIRRRGAGHGEIETVDLGDRASAIPSVLFVAPDGTVLVGDAAERRAVTDPGRVVREFKRRIGDPTPLVVGGAPMSPQDLSARLVRWVVDRVAERQGGPADGIAVTHPASWGAHRRELLGAALAAQGLPVTFLAEPQAAALHYAAAERVEPGSTIAVYDLGGGTFDAAVARKADGTFALLGRAEGIDGLGGIDFDEAVFEHVRAGLPAAFEGLDDTDPGVLAAVAQLRRECTEAKEALSADTEVSIPVLMPGAQGSVRLHRGEFEALIRERVEDTVAALRRAVASAGLTPDELSAVLLVGGSSRIPLVAQLVSEQLGRPIAVDADPKYAIAKGAVLALAPAARSATGALPSVPAAAAAAAASGASPLSPTDPALPTRSAAPERPLPVPPPRPPAAPPPLPAAPDEGTYAAPATVAGRRSPAALVGAGGVAAAVAVVGAILLWPGQEPPASVIGSDLGGLPTSAEPPPTTTATEQPLPADPAPAPVADPEPRPEPEPAPQPAPTTTSTPPETSAAPPPPPPSSEPPPPSSEPSPPPSTSDLPPPPTVTSGANLPDP